MFTDICESHDMIQTKPAQNIPSTKKTLHKLTHKFECCILSGVNIIWKSDFKQGDILSCIK